MDALVEIIERLSFFASQNPDITELDINPLMASAAGCRAVDARIIWG
jgi:succinyl-CoA synthetase beta subunit